MATRTYYLDRGGTTPAKKPADSHQKMKIFPTIEEAERSIDDIAEGEIVATDNDTDDSSTIPPNILNYVRDQNELSGWEDFTLSTSSSSPTTMPYDGYISFRANHASDGQNYGWIFVNNVQVTGSNAGSEPNFAATGSCAVKKGDKVYIQLLRMTYQWGRANFYKKRDYSGR